MITINKKVLKINQNKSKFLEGILIVLWQTQYMLISYHNESQVCLSGEQELEY